MWPLQSHPYYCRSDYASLYTSIYTISSRNTTLKKHTFLIGLKMFNIVNSYMFALVKFIYSKSLFYSSIPSSFLKKTQTSNYQPKKLKLKTNENLHISVKYCIIGLDHILASSFKRSAFGWRYSVHWTRRQTLFLTLETSLKISYS